MKKLIIAVIALLVVTGSNLRAQQFAEEVAPTPKYNDSNWTVGLGMNILENNGFRVNGLFKINYAAIMPYPDRLSLARKLGAGFFLEGTFDYNEELPGKLVNLEVNPILHDYYMLDLTTKYCFFHRKKAPVQPFLLCGFGLTHNRAITGSETFGSFNAGFGFDVCFNNIVHQSSFMHHFTLGFQALGKWTGNISQYYIYSFTILYRVPEKIKKPETVK